VEQFKADIFFMFDYVFKIYHLCFAAGLTIRASGLEAAQSSSEMRAMKKELKAALLEKIRQTIGTTAAQQQP